MAQFAIPTPDENLVPGWNVQDNILAGGQTGFAQPAAVPASSVTSLPPVQSGSGLPNPPGAMNVGAENSAAYGVPVLSNPGYATGNGTNLSATPVTTPVPTTAGVQQPFGLSAQATIVYPSGVTAIYVCPFQSTGMPAGTASPWVAVLSGNAAAGTINVDVPSAGYVKTAGVNATSVTYTPIF